MVQVFLVDIVIAVAAGVLGGALAAVIVDAIKHRGFFWNA